MSNKGKIISVKRVFQGKIDLNQYFKGKFIDTYENLIKNK